MEFTSGSAVAQLVTRLSTELQLPEPKLQATSAALGSFLEALQGRRGSQPNGILLGRVQSGKTTAMLLLCAAARDRGEQVIVLLLGTTTILYGLSRHSMSHAGKQTGPCSALKVWQGVRSLPNEL